MVKPFLKRRDPNSLAARYEEGTLTRCAASTIVRGMNGRHVCGICQEIIR